jgi:hypothetical protein
MSLSLIANQMIEGIAETIVYIIVSHSHLGLDPFTDKCLIPVNRFRLNPNESQIVY